VLYFGLCCSFSRSRRAPRWRSSDRRRAAPPTGRQRCRRREKTCRPAEVDLKKEIATLRRELGRSAGEAKPLRSEVLQVISASVGELEPVFSKRCWRNAEPRVCGAKFGTMHLVEGGHRSAGSALQCAPLPTAEGARGHGCFDLIRKGGLGQVIRTKQVAQIADVRTNPAYLEGSPVIVALSDLAGARTLVAVPMLRDGRTGRHDRGLSTRGPPRSPTSRFELLSNFRQGRRLLPSRIRGCLGNCAKTYRRSGESLRQQTATADVLKVISSLNVRSAERAAKRWFESAARLCEADKATITRQKKTVRSFVPSHTAISDEFMDYVRNRPPS